MSHRHKRNHAPGSPQQAPPESPAEANAEAFATSHGFPSEHRPGLLPEEYFRWRAGEITRLEAFCDVVFGFALTLLVVSLEVPRNYGELMVAMRGFVPFALCFTMWTASEKHWGQGGLEPVITC